MGAITEDFDIPWGGFIMASSPRHRQIRERIARWYRNWRTARAGVFELQCAGAAEVQRIAQDLGISSFELHALAGRPDDRELLARRMEALHLEPKGLAQMQPAAWRDLQRVCALCGVRNECARDLDEQARDPAWQEWRNYCPNATTLSALAALEACSEARTSNNQEGPACRIVPLAS
jgi:hypothetical protein